MSEPSNPWVNGVAGLFTTEWYRDVKRYLAPGGLLVQWLQTYEFNDRLLASILAALGENFADFEVYEMNGVDLIVVAVAEGTVPRPGPLPGGETDFLGQLKRLGITRSEEIAALRVGSKRELAPLFAPLAAPVNSDYYPYVQLEAPRARFHSSFASTIPGLLVSPLPVLEMTQGTTLTYLSEPVPHYVPSLNLRTRSAAVEFARRLLNRSASPFAPSEQRVVMPLLTLKQPGALCGPAPSKTAIDQLHNAAEMTLVKLAPAPRRALWIERRWLDCPPGKLSPHVRQRLELYAAIAARDAPAMQARARALLKQGAAEGGDDFGRFLLLTAMLGARAAGDHGEARRLWSAYGTVLYRGADIPAHVRYVANLN